MRNTGITAVYNIGVGPTGRLNDGPNLDRSIDPAFLGSHGDIYDTEDGLKIRAAFR
ncbi:MAG: hypothetical protein AAFS11_00675 [Planctomycetota bacterium]